jgi:hypothetical protein
MITPQVGVGKLSEKLEKRVVEFHLEFRMALVKTIEAVVLFRNFNSLGLAFARLKQKVEQQ